MTRQEVNKSITEEILQKKVEEVNNLLIGTKVRISLTKEKQETDKIFNYTIQVIDGVTNNVISSRILIDKYDVMQYLDGMVKMNILLERK